MTWLAFIKQTNHNMVYFMSEVQFAIEELKIFKRLSHYMISRRN